MFLGTGCNVILLDRRKDAPGALRGSNGIQEIDFIGEWPATFCHLYPPAHLQQAWLHRRLRV
jgi:hypothetical protein